MTSTLMRGGIGLRSAHYREFLAMRPPVGYVEVHSENFFGRRGAAIGGQPRALLEQVRADYALSLHGVGLSLGSAEPLQLAHLHQLKLLADWTQAQWVSDHLAWVGVAGQYLNDLLPLPYTEESLALVCANVDAVQSYLGRRLLVENPSSYLSFDHSTIDEIEFIAELVQRTGCAMLLDLNNVFVSAFNLGFEIEDYLNRVPWPSVEQIHLAGFTATEDLLIDTHSRAVDPAVWALYTKSLSVRGDVPTLIEWDADLPPLQLLLAQAEQINTLRQSPIKSFEDRCDLIA